MTTMIEAVDDMHERFYAVWQPLGHPAKYQDVASDPAMDAAIDSGLVPWARVTVRHNLKDQTTLAGPDGSRFTSRGILFIEVYTPTGDGCVLSRTLCPLIEKAYQGISTPNGVWFTKVQTQEIGNEGMWYHANVSCLFKYDSIKSD